MNSLAIKQGRPQGDQDVFHLVHRRHDLSGCDYEGLMRLDRGVAHALGRNGVVVRERNSISMTGRPGIVLTENGHDAPTVIDLRADVADPTTSIDSVAGEPGFAGLILGDATTVDIGWVGKPPKEPGELVTE